MRLTPGLFALTCMLSAASAQTTARQEPADINLQVLNQWITDLANDDFKVREAAQAHLNALPARLRPALQQRLEEATDPEVKSRLRISIDAIGVRLATQCAPISLELLDASLGQAVAALNEALNDPHGTIHITAPKIPVADDVHFTLKVENRPFWEVVARLHSQHPLIIDNSNNVMSIGLAQPGVHILKPLHPASVDGTSGFALYIADVVPGTPRDAFLAARGAPQAKLNYALLADPRLRIMPVHGPDFLQTSSGPMKLRNIDLDSFGLQHSPLHSVFPLDFAPDARIVSTEVQARFLVPVNDQTRELVFPNLHISEELKVGNAGITIKNFEIQDRTIGKIIRRSLRMDLRVATDSPAEAGPPARPLNQETFLQLILTDLEGKQLLSTTTTETGTHTLSISLNPQQIPFTLTLIAPERIQKITVPFTLKNIPQP